MIVPALNIGLKSDGSLTPTAHDEVCLFSAIGSAVNRIS